jgi:hypothetical protein
MSPPSLGPDGNRSVRCHGDIAQPAGYRGISEQVVGEERVEIEDGGVDTP